MDPDTKILVLGARGLVGSALVRELRAQGYANLLTPTHAELDLLNENAVRWYFSVHEPQRVFFCAARVGGIAANVASPVEFLEENLRMELHVIQQAAAYNVEKLVFVGTSCCYPRDCPQPMKPEHLWTGPLEKTTEPYSVAKLAGIKLCQYYHAQGRDFVSALPCNIYGERDNFDPETAHCLPGLLSRLHTSKLAGDSYFRIWGKPEIRREFLHATDLAKGLIRVMESYRAPDPVNIGSGLELTMQELGIILADVVGYEGRIEFDVSRPAGVPRKVLDSSVIRSFGWRPEMPFLAGVHETYEWFRLNS